MIWRFYQYALLFFVAFLCAGIAANTAIRHYTTPPYMGLLTDKVDSFLKHKDKINILFIGTSRTFRQIHTPLMEKNLKQCGAPTLFNMGIPNLTYAELNYVLKHVKHSNPENLKMVIIGEPMAALRLDIRRLSTDRVRFFSDIKGTQARLENIISYQEPLTKKALRFILAIAGFIYEQSNFGHISHLIFPELYESNNDSHAETKNMPKDWMTEHRGYYALQKPGQINEFIQSQHEKFLANIDQFTKLLETQKNKAGKENIPSNKTRTALYKNILMQIEEQGWQHALYLPPLPNRVSANATLIKVLNKDTRLFFYNNPKRDSVFWQPDQWFDEAHLNDNASEKLSLDIAKRLCPITKEWGI